MSQLHMAHEPRTVWILLSPTPDVEGQWTAHCLDLDVISQGDSLEHAFKMGREAVDLVIRSDAEAGQDPFERDPAPQEDWDTFHDLLRNAVPLKHVPREKWGTATLVAVPYSVCVRDIAEEQEQIEQLPAWMISHVVHESSRDSGAFRTL
ncbi:MAG TPA: hypothetical protein VJN18_26925 [Polyangiaceae bacterium]|nr:hypothetical protein [Polyangiaceae bacterium]